MAAEHESEPVRESAPVSAEPVAQPAVVANPFEGAGAGPAPTAITPPQALALQRSAGNRAVSRLLARQPAPAGAQPTPPPPGTGPNASATTKAGLTPYDFTPTGGDPSTSGTVSVTAKGDHMVTLNAPKITASGSVEWKPRTAPVGPAPGGATPSGHAPSTPTPPGTPPAATGAPPASAGGAPPERPKEVRAGWINTVFEGSRIFTYTEDGTPGGKVVRSEQMRAPAGSRDATWANDPRTGTQVPHSSSDPPFYGPAKRMSENQSVTLENFEDQPGADAAREIETSDGKKGKLAKVGGQDKFRLSLAVTEVGNNDTVHLTAKEWTVPWDVTLDQKGMGTGKGISIDDYKGRLEDIKRGEGFSVGEAGRFPWPQTPEEVKGFSTNELIQAIPYAEKQDVGTWTLMCQELRSRNPSATVTVLVTNSAATLKDNFTITISGAKTVSKSAAEWFSAKPVKFSLLEMMDPQDIKTGLVLTISVVVEGSTPQPMTWPWPFGSMRATRYWWDTSGAVKGEWTDTKGARRDTSSDVTITVAGF